MYIYRKVGPKGQVVIPEPVRRILGVRAGSEVEFDVHGREAVVRLADRLRTVREFCEVLPKKKRIEIDSDKNYEEEMEERHGNLFRR